MIEPLVRIVSRIVWKDVVSVNMKRDLTSVLVYAMSGVWFVVAGLFLLFAFFRWLQTVGVTTPTAATGAALLSFVFAVLLVLFWRAFSRKSVKKTINDDLLEEIVVAFLKGVQRCESERKTYPSEQEYKKNVSNNP